MPTDWSFKFLKKTVCVQVAREAHFSGQSYLDLGLSNIPTLRNNFYASFSFRTEEKEGLMFYHQDKVGTTSCLSAPTAVCPAGSYQTLPSCVQDGVCQVFLHDGYVVVRAGNSEIKTLKTYNDDNTHYVSIYNNING